MLSIVFYFACHSKQYPTRAASRLYSVILINVWIWINHERVKIALISIQHSEQLKVCARRPANSPFLFNFLIICMAFAIALRSCAWKAISNLRRDHHGHKNQQSGYLYKLRISFKHSQDNTFYPAPAFQSAIAVNFYIVENGAFLLMLISGENEQHLWYRWVHLDQLIKQFCVIIYLPWCGDQNTRQISNYMQFFARTKNHNDYPPNGTKWSSSVVEFTGTFGCEMCWYFSVQIGEIKSQANENGGQTALTKWNQRI